MTLVLKFETKHGKLLVYSFIFALRQINFVAFP